MPPRHHAGFIRLHARVSSPPCGSDCAGVPAARALSRPDWLGARPSVRRQVFQPLWNRTFIRSVQILFSEDFGTEGRGGYFDNYGAQPNNKF